MAGLLGRKWDDEDEMEDDDPAGTVFYRPTFPSAALVLGLATGFWPFTTAPSIDAVLELPQVGRRIVEQARASVGSPFPFFAATRAQALCEVLQHLRTRTAWRHALSSTAACCGLAASSSSSHFTASCNNHTKACGGCNTGTRGPGDSFETRRRTQHLQSATELAFRSPTSGSSVFHPAH